MIGADIRTILSDGNPQIKTKKIVSERIDSH